MELNLGHFSIRNWRREEMNNRSCVMPTIERYG